MNCRERQHDIVLFLYDELGIENRNELRVHMDRCVECQQFYENEKQVHFRLTEDFSEWEVPADLLMESRRSLSDELDRLEEKRWRLEDTLIRAPIPKGTLAGVCCTCIYWTRGRRLCDERTRTAPRTARPRKPTLCDPHCNSRRRRCFKPENYGSRSDNRPDTTHRGGLCSR